MIFKPAQLGMAKLDRQELEEDKKSCKKIGPCGVGRKALYLNSFYIDRRYYLPYGSITRVFKRVAMSSGGFSGKGMFASMAYLVVEYDGGKQKQCNFKDERDVDKLLEVLAKEQPQIHLLSAAGEQALEKKEAEKAARKLPESELTDDARHSITVLRKAKEYLEAKSGLSDELSAAERRKRAQLQSKPVYRYVALAIFIMGIVSAAYGLYAVTTHTGGYGIYFALFGFAAIFLFSSYNMLPTAHNNHSAIMKRAEKAEAAMAEYVKHYPNGAFPVPSQYAHPHRAQANDRCCRRRPRRHRAGSTDRSGKPPESPERRCAGRAGGVRRGGGHQGHVPQSRLSVSASYAAREPENPRIFRLSCSIMISAVSSTLPAESS